MKGRAPRSRRCCATALSRPGILAMPRLPAVSATLCPALMVPPRRRLSSGARTSAGTVSTRARGRVGRGRRTAMRQGLSVISHVVHRYFIWLLLGSYAVAAVYPALGLQIRQVSFGQVAVFGEPTTIPLPMVMLALLTFNAGMGVQ